MVHGNINTYNLLYAGFRSNNYMYQQVSFEIFSLSYTMDNVQFSKQISFLDNEVLYSSYENVLFGEKTAIYKYFWHCKLLTLWNHISTLIALELNYVQYF